MLLHCNLSKLSPRTYFTGFCLKTLNTNYSLKPRSFYTTGSMAGMLPTSLSNGSRLRPLKGKIFFSSGLGKMGYDKSKSPRAEKTLPWIAAHEERERKDDSKNKAPAKSKSSSWEQSAEKFFARTGEKPTRANWNRLDRGQKEFKSTNFTRQQRFKQEEEEEEEDMEQIDNPKWYKIRDKYKPLINNQSPNSRFEKPEIKQWNNQENWGKKTWKEATESTVPKLVGQGVYGVGPVLSALTAGRREFFALYIQENLDLNGNNKKKKDKKGVEKVLNIAEKIGLKVIETSKHDLNMATDNRPHQGLVLDASPLEMVNIRELDRITLKQGEKAPIWVALDEVTDPQNLGAIVRSAYFFGAQGVILCAKNSAPLTGVVSKASAGSLELIELRSCKNMMQFLVSSMDNGWRVLGGSVSSKADPITEIESGVPTILVLGSEGTGLRPLVERSCTQLVKINGCIDGFVEGKGVGLEGGEESNLEVKSFLAVESLNVSVAAGVLLYHLVGRNSQPCEKED